MLTWSDVDFTPSLCVLNRSRSTTNENVHGKCKCKYQSGNFVVRTVDLLRALEKLWARNVWHTHTKSVHAVYPICYLHLRHCVYFGNKKFFRAHFQSGINTVKNNTWMCGNMKFISSVYQDISWVNKWDILFNTRNNFIFPDIHVLFCLLY